MSNRYMKPEDFFEIDLKIKVKVNFVGEWDGIRNQNEFEDDVNSFVKSGGMKEYIKEVIEEDLKSEVFDICGAGEFDRICFDVVDTE